MSAPCNSTTHRTTHGQSDVHGRPGNQHLEPLPLALRQELVGRTAALVFGGLAGHLDEAAKGNGGDLVLGATAGEAQEPWTEADGKGEHAHANAPGREEMAQLVDENEHADTKAKASSVVNTAVDPLHWQF